MKHSLERHDRYTVLRLQGEFDTFHCPIFLRNIDRLIESGERQLVLDMRLVKFINSTALGSIIRASKKFTAEGGKIAIARPSSFCRQVMETVGLDRLVPIFESDDDAARHLLDWIPAPEIDDARVFERDESAVLFAPTDKARIEQYIPESKRVGQVNKVHGHEFGKNWRGVGDMAAVNREGVRFTWNGGDSGLSATEIVDLLAAGTDIGIKFRLPLLERGHHEAVVTVTAAEPRDDGVRITASYKDIDDETRDAVVQYNRDLAYLKSELSDSTGAQ